MLTDQIQGSVNSTLRYLFASWKTQISGLNERVQSLSSQDEEALQVDKAIGVYVNEMIKQTLKVYELAMALSERDPASAAATTFETMQETLQQTGLANVFKLYWDKLCTNFGPVWDHVGTRA